MTSANYLKQSFSDEDDIIGTLQEMRENIESNNWEQSSNYILYLQKAWKKVQNRVQFSVEKIRLHELENSLSKLKGAVYAKNKDIAIIEIEMLLYYWKHLDG